MHPPASQSIIVIVATRGKTMDVPIRHASGLLHFRDQTLQVMLEAAKECKS